MNKLANWFKTIIPSMLAIVLWVFDHMRRKLKRERLNHEKTKLEKKLLQNEKQVRRAFKNRSHADIILDAVERGKRLENDKRDGRTDRYEEED